MALALVQLENGRTNPIPSRTRFRDSLLAIYRLQTELDPARYDAQMQVLERDIATVSIAAMALGELHGDWERFAAGTPQGDRARRVRSTAQAAVDGHLGNLDALDLPNDRETHSLLRAIRIALGRPARPPQRREAEERLQRHFDEFRGRWNAELALTRLPEDVEGQWLHFHLVFSQLYQFYPGMARLQSGVVETTFDAFVTSLRWARRQGEPATLMGFYRALERIHLTAPLRDSRGRPITRIAPAAFELSSYFAIRLLEMFPNPQSPENFAARRAISLLGDPRVHQGSLCNWFIHVLAVRTNEGAEALRRQIQEIHAVWQLVREIDTTHYVLISREAQRMVGELLPPSFDLFVVRRTGTTIHEDGSGSSTTGTAVLIREIKQLSHTLETPAGLSNLIRSTIAKMTRILPQRAAVDTNDSVMVWGPPELVNQLTFNHFNGYRSLVIQIPWEHNDIVVRPTDSPNCVRYMAPNGEYEIVLERPGNARILERGNFWQQVCDQSVSRIRGNDYLDEILITDYDGRVVAWLLNRRRTARALGRPADGLPAWVAIDLSSLTD